MIIKYVAMNGCGLYGLSFWVLSFAKGPERINFFSLHQPTSGTEMFQLKDIDVAHGHVAHCTLPEIWDENT